MNLFIHVIDAIFLISTGESGAGKTEASKYVMHYIATMSQSMEIARVKNLLIVSNPLLESFGNARTVRNDNSSRFVSLHKQMLYINERYTCKCLANDIGASNIGIELNT